MPIFSSQKWLFWVCLAPKPHTSPHHTSKMYFSFFYSQRSRIYILNWIQKIIFPFFLKSKIQDWVNKLNLVGGGGLENMTQNGGNMTNYPYFIPQEKCESGLGRGGPIDSLLSLTTETKLELRFLAWQLTLLNSILFFFENMAIFLRMARRALFSNFPPHRYRQKAPFWPGYRTHVVKLLYR